MPGVWEDGNGHIHFSIPEIHAHLGIPNSPREIADTLANLELYFAPVLEGVRKAGGTTIVRAEKPDHGDETAHN